MAHKKVFWMRALILSSALYTSAHSAPALTPPRQNWSFQGMLGSFKRDALQRGFQVYKEVCSACHSLKFVRFRELKAIGFSDAEVKALAAEYTMTMLNSEGESVDRPGLPSDALPSPYPNELAARAVNNGAYPPDQSLIVKARKHGADYIYALLTGYGKTPPKGMTLGTGQHYNPYMPGGKIAMEAPLKEGQVTYADGTKATVAQMAHDVTTFLSWTAEPESEERKRQGITALLYLLIMSGLFYAAKRKIWKSVK